jgi:hypothetical protein
MFMQRILGVFRLDPATFENIEHDPGAISQAAAVVAIAAFLAGTGAAFQSMFSDASAVGSFLSSLLWTFFGWAIWSFISYLVGTRLFPGQATFPEMLRVIGFAYAPQVLAIIPCVGALLGAVWPLAAGFVAIRQGLDLDNWRTLLTIVAGFLVYLLGGALLNLIFVGFPALF